MKARRKLLTSLVGILVVAAASLGTVVGLGYTPALGLDLQGGASVVLRPTEDVPEENLEQAISIIRNRVDGLGVAEPEIARQGDAIIVQLPGVADRQNALDVVGQTAELRFRPVLEQLPPEGQPLPGGATPPAEGEGDDAQVEEGAPAEEEAPAEEQAPAEGDAPAEGEGGGEEPTAEVEESAGEVDEPVARITTAADEEAPAEEAPADGEGEEAPADDTTPTTTSPPAEVETTDPQELEADQEAVLPGESTDGEPPVRYRVGPTRLFGEAVDTASASVDSAGVNWAVDIRMTDEGIDAFNELAAECYNTAETCPPVSAGDGGVRGAVAIELDGVVVSAPTINSPNFSQNDIQITGEFTQEEAQSLALVLRYGSLPVELEPETVQTVSATLGNDSLRAGLIAGAIGLGLVILYMLAYYRLLGLVALVSLTVSGALLYAIIAYLGESTGLALTLAGITGIIVSIGVAMDSNVVYYERVKESALHGTTLRSSTDRGFKRAFSTILRADAASLIGAALLYYFTVGPVRGFAFYLGLSTVLDVVTSYFFMRPAVVLLGRSKRSKPSWFGVPKRASAAAAPVVAGGGR